VGHKHATSHHGVGPIAVVYDTSIVDCSCTARRVRTFMHAFHELPMMSTSTFWIKLPLEVLLEWQSAA
jgi:hypothetical protein